MENGRNAPGVQGMRRIRGVVFDLDGTVVVERHDYEAIRRELGFPPGLPLLEEVEKLPPPRRTLARQVLLKHEQAAADQASLNPGVRAFLDRLDRHRIRRGLLTRNTRATAEAVLVRCGLRFEPVVAREDAPFKPSPHGLWHICRVWGMEPTEVLMIGDYLYDLEAGRNAGTHTALVTHGRDLAFADLADLTFPSFEELPDQLFHWFVGTH
jgi:HAD superfamily hydrolase (TIGR01549 family)